MKAVYFVRRIDKGNQNYSFSGTTYSPDPVSSHRKVLKDWVAAYGMRLGVEAGERLAIKNQTTKGQWAFFTLASSGQARFLGWNA